jgi:hypothetical protein
LQEIAGKEKGYAAAAARHPVGLYGRYREIHRGCRIAIAKL